MGNSVRKFALELRKNLTFCCNSADLYHKNTNYIPNEKYWRESVFDIAFDKNMSLKITSSMEGLKCKRIQR